MSQGAKTIIKIYVRLLEEGTDSLRPTQAVVFENGTCKILPTEDYDPEDEIWEFPPDSIVSRKKKTLANGETIFVATRPPVSREALLQHYVAPKIVSICVKSDDTVTGTVLAEAVALGHGFFKILPPSNSSFNTDAWEYAPGAIVTAQKKYDTTKGNVLIAFDQIREDRLDSDYAHHLAKTAEKEP